MIKLASFALMPVVLAAFYTQQEPQPSSADLRRAQVEEQDRQFLASLNSPGRSFTDQDFLANLQAEERRSVKHEMRVLRAIPIDPAIPMARVTASVVRRDLPEETREVRRAVAVVRASPSNSVRQGARTTTMETAPSSSSSANLRNTLQEPYTILGASEIRRSAGEGRRASIMIYGDQVVLR